MNIIFLPAAELEWQEASDWYSAEKNSLAERFDTELSNVIQRISETPLQFHSFLKIIDVHYSVNFLTW